MPFVSRRRHRIPAVLHVIVIATLALTLIGPFATPQAAEAARLQVPAEGPVVANPETDPPPGKPTPPTTPVASSDAPATGQVGEVVSDSPEEPVDEIVAEPTSTPTTEEPVDEIVAEPTSTPTTEEPVDEIVAEPTSTPTTEEPVDEIVAEPTSTPTTEDIDLEPKNPGIVANNEMATAATMRFSNAQAIGPASCNPGSVMFVGLDVNDADPTFRGVEIFLLATSVPGNQTTVLGSTIVEASRGSGTFFQPVEGDFSAGFKDWRVELYLVDGAGNDRQSQILQVVPACVGGPPTTPPMRFTSVFVIGPDTCTAASDVRVQLTVNDTDPTFRGVEIRLLATRTATGSPVVFSGPTIDPSRGNGTFTEFIQGNFTTEFANWQVQLILFNNEGGIHQRQTFPVKLNCTPPPPEVPTEVPTETPTEVPTETPTEVPTETPTEVPTETPTEVPTETPTEVPTETPTEVPIIDEPNEDTPNEEGPFEEPAGDSPVIDVPSVIPPEAPSQPQADKVTTSGPADTVLVAELPVAGSGIASSHHPALLLATVASSLVLAFISVTVHCRGVRQR